MRGTLIGWGVSPNFLDISSVQGDISPVQGGISEPEIIIPLVTLEWRWYENIPPIENWYTPPPKTKSAGVPVWLAMSDAVD